MSLVKKNSSRERKVRILNVWFPTVIPYTESGGEDRDRGTSFNQQQISPLPSPQYATSHQEEEKEVKLALLVYKKPR